MNFKKIGLIIADKDEYEPFLKVLGDREDYDTPFEKSITFKVGNSRVYAVCSGMGKVNAATATMFLAQRGCDVILNFGLSGGLSGVKSGQFILPDSFIEYDFDLSPFGYKPCEKPGQTYIYKADRDLLEAFKNSCNASIMSVAACGDRFVNDTKSREFLINEFSASSCDMETAAIASVCHLMKLPFLSLRRISDDASDDAVQKYGEMYKNEGGSLAETFIDCLKSICAEV